MDTLRCRVGYGCGMRTLTWAWLAAAIATASIAPGAVVAAESDAIADDWLAEEERLRAKIDAVNEGELHFLASAEDLSVHHHAAQISITPASLLDGWVEMRQCHVNLDRVAAAQILFNPSRSRGLTVSSFRNIDAAYAEGNSIQLRGVGDDSEICLSAESRALHRLDDGIFELQNGPFMRRFLDGYYPLQLSLRIDFPATLMLFDHRPEAQPGFAVETGAGQVAVEAIFEGELRTAFRFVER